MASRDHPGSIVQYRDRPLSRRAAVEGKEGREEEIRPSPAPPPHWEMCQTSGNNFYAGQSAEKQQIAAARRPTGRLLYNTSLVAC